VGRKKQNKFPSNLYCPVKKLNYFLFQFYRYRICLVCLFTLVANGCVYETLGIAGYVPICRYKRRCGAELLN